VFDLRLSGTFGARVLDRVTTGPFSPEEWGDRHLDPELGGWNKLTRTFGPHFRRWVTNERVAEFGSASGLEAAAVAEVAELVVGYEVREDDLARATVLAQRQPNLHFCRPGEGAFGPFGLIYSINALEHCADPAALLGEMYRLVRVRGKVVLSFGPTWYHPYAARMRNVTQVPWVHLLFAEQTVLAKYNAVTGEHIARYEDSGHKLNRMTIRTFKRLVRDIGFDIRELRAVPIRPARFVHPLAKEFLTSCVFAVLIKDPYGAPEPRSAETRRE
jgi:SAM-dependent methyltransferase